MKIRNHPKPKPPANAKPAPVDTTRCTATTLAGTRCRLAPGPLCRIHRKQAAGKP